jgi:pilus assembly protein CpaF
LIASARWILISPLRPEQESSEIASRVAHDLALRQPVLFWDIAKSVGPEKTWEELLPYYNVFSVELLRNYLREEGGNLCVLRGAPSASGKLFYEVTRLLQNSFTYVIMSALPDWSKTYRSLLDRANALWLTAPADRSNPQELRPHLDQLVKYRFPKALARVIPDSRDPLDIHRLAQRLETQELYCESQEVDEQTERDIRNRIHERLLDTPELGATPRPDRTRAVLEDLISEDPLLSVPRRQRERLFSDLLHDVTGLGPLESLLEDPSISEIMVNGTHTVFIEKQGKLYPTESRFDDETQLRTVIDRIVAPIGRRVDESAPLCDARLPDGSRVHIVLPPLALDGPTLTIRKFPEKRLELDDLIQRNALNSEMGQYLERCVRSRKNIVVSGGTGSGKTTLLNILSGFIAAQERIVTIEDAAELRLRQPHVVRLESRPPNVEGQGAVPIRQLVMNALRMRPDRIVVGECRGGEALDMLQAMNTGHDGSLTTLHANSPRDALGRLETLVLMAGIDLPLRVVREQIRSAIQIIIQVARLPDGERKITSITELTGMEGEVLTTGEVFRYNAGRFEITGFPSLRD